MPEDANNKTIGGRSGRDADMAFLSGIEDIVLPDELPEETSPPPQKTEYSSEYERWLEENLKEAKGYGQKISYEGEIPEEDGSWYENSTYAAYDKQMAEAQQLIVSLKEQDAKNKARDDFIHDILPRMNSWQNYSGDPGHFLAMIGSILWYGVSAGAGAGVAFACGSRGTDMIPFAGVGGLIGAIIRYNGKEGYSLTEAMAHGAAEIGLLIASFVIGVWSFFGNVPYQAILLIAGAFGALGVVVRERIFFVRPWTEAFFKALPYLLAPPVGIALVIVYHMLQAATSTV